MNRPGPADLTEEEIAKRREPFICTRPCKTDMNCGRHKCMELCCPHKGQKSDGTFHVCTQTCDKLLNCGKHHCYLPCHPGPMSAYLVDTNHMRLWKDSHQASCGVWDASTGL